MFKCALCSKYHIEAVRAVLATCPDLKHYPTFIKWWESDVDTGKRRDLLLLVGITPSNGIIVWSGIYYIALNFNHDDYKSGDGKSDKYDKETKAALHQLHGRLLQQQEYTEVELLFSNCMSERLFKYLTRLGIKNPVDAMKLYVAGGYSDTLKHDVELALSRSFIDEVIPPDTEVKFGADYSSLLTVIPEAKWQYIRLPSYCNDIPNDIKSKLGRKVGIVYEGDTSSVVTEMEKSGKYTSEDIEFLYKYVEEGNDSMSFGSLTSSRKIKLIGDLKLRM